MNICFSIGTLAYSGAEKIMYYLVKEFEKKGDTVSLILLSSKEPFGGLDNIKQYPIYGEYCDKKNRFSRTLECHKAIRKIVHENKFDVIVSFGVIFNIDIAEACLFEKTKLVLCERNDPVYDPHSTLLRLRRKVAYARGNAFVFQTEIIKSFFSKSIQKKSAVIPNFIEKKIPQDEMYCPLRNSFATSARLDDRQKDQSTMIKAFAVFLQEHPGYELEIYGDGPDKNVLSTLAAKLGIQNNVVFKGRVHNPMSFIRSSKAFILSSVYEGMPNSLIEAMAYAMPCISSECSGGGANALIDDEKNGLLFPVGDVDKLARLMNKVIDDAEFAYKIGQNASEVNRILDKNAIIKKWADVIYGVVGE